MESLFDAPAGAVNVAVLPTLSSTSYGKWAEQLAIVELLRRGHRVAVPVADDDGVDLVVNYRLRVQVKNAFRSTKGLGPGGSYLYDGFAWSAKCGWLKSDVYLLHGDEGGASRWWVVPAEVLVGHGATLLLYEGARRSQRRSRASIVREYEDAWHLFDG